MLLPSSKTQIALLRAEPKAFRSHACLPSMTSHRPSSASIATIAAAPFPRNIITAAFVTMETSTFAWIVLKTTFFAVVTDIG